MNIVVFCGSSQGSDPRFTDAAVALGTWIGSHAHDLVWGGCKTGLMGAVADATAAAGGRRIAVQVDVPGIMARRYEGAEDYIVAPDLLERKKRMIALGDAFAVLPGGPGTLDELGDVLALAKAYGRAYPLFIIGVDGFYEPLREYLRAMVDAGFFSQQAFDAIRFLEFQADKPFELPL